MDNLVDDGGRWFCTAVHAVGTASFEMQTCSDDGVRYWIGVTTLFATLLLGIIALWQLGDRRLG